jgi:Fe-S cluster biogenesis protein NfuA
MFIQTEETPNPSTLKFIPGRDVLPGGRADFPDAEAASASPLAQRLFKVEGVKSVFLADDFVAITKAADQQWHLMKPAVLSKIMEHFMSGEPVIRQALADANAIDEADDEIVVQIKELLDAKVRPAVAQDGGDIVFHGFERGIVYLSMKGACAGCPSSTATLKMGIENMLRYYIPEVVEVRQISQE